MPQCPDEEEAEVTVDNKETLKAVTAKMEALVGGKAQLQAYLSDSFCSAFKVPPPVPPGMCDYGEYERKIEELQQQQVRTIESLRFAETALEAFKKKTAGDAGDKLVKGECHNMENIVLCKQMEVIDSRRRLYYFVEGTIPINSAKFQAEMLALIDEKILLLARVRQDEIQALRSAEPQQQA